MVEPTLALAAALTYVVGLTYLYVGVSLGRRRALHPDPARPMLFFAIWWTATSINQMVGATLYMGAAFGFVDLPVQMSYVVVQRTLLSISLVGLMYYLIFLQTGRARLVPLVVFYGAYYVASLYTVVARGPVGVESFGWRTDLVFARELPRAWGLLNLAIVVPPVLGALALLRLYPRVEGRTRRFRIAMLGGGFVVWWVTAVVAGQPSTFDVTALQIANRIIGVAIALGILVAYEPRAWMVNKLGFERQALS